MARVSLNNLTKRYAGNPQPSLDRLSLDIEDGEFLVLVGPSGCGKSTALKMIAGLEDISDGEVRIGDELVNDLPARERDIAMIFQSYALYPHMSVYDNIAFPLQIAKVPKAEIDSRVRQVARTLQLEDYLARKPGKLSGGQRQRVAMGRAIIRQPSVFLMDEPLSNLDAKLRGQMRSEIAQLQDRLGVTTIYVTHDQVEAMTMGDRVALLKDGVLQQIDTPSGIYDNPANTFVAAFIGSPSMNLFHGTLEPGGDGRTLVRLGSRTLRLPASLLAERPGLAAYSGREVIVGLRPEIMDDAALKPGHPDDMTLDVTVFLAEALGSDLIAHFALDAAQARVVDRDSLEQIVPADATGVAVARFGARSGARNGKAVRVAVECDRLHFFDPERGEAIR
ncbi:MAG: sn-glycerol-3-phosphate ABC transporter ATP-binding protein UgpC [Rhizobiales bacterium]|nr:sn-glycerol-3-phosphate ABC transporter ATP-binding protein UgpC [Hyphomicrobiales bacterium]